MASLNLGQTSGTIGSYVFAGCDSPNDLNLPSTWFEKGWGTFYDCSGLTHIEIPDGVTKLGGYIFAYCTYLRDATFGGDAPLADEFSFYNADLGFTVFYHRSASGFTTPAWNGYATVELAPGIKVREVPGTVLASGGSPRDFGGPFVGNRASLDFEITNTGNVTLTNLAISKTGPHRRDFLISRLSRTSLPSGQQTMVHVEFAPAFVGKRACTMLIASSDSDANPFAISLVGRGARPPGPEIVVYQPGGRHLVDGISAKGFQRIKVGRKSTAKTFWIKNAGDMTLKDLSITETGSNRRDFIISSFLGTSLRPGDSMTFKVRFKPSAKGARSATIHLKSNDADEKSFDIKLRGSGK